MSDLENRDTANLSPQAKAAIKSAVPSALLPLTLARSCIRSTIERAGFSVPNFPGRVLSDVDPERILLKLDVFSLLVPEAGAAELAAQLQPELKRHGTQALVTATDPKEFSYIFGEGVLAEKGEYEKEALVVFFQSETPEPLFWVRGTNGENYDLTTDKILSRLKEWAERCEFSVLGAGFDWVELRFKTLPVNVEEFAEEVYDFCPDTLDQGIVLPLPEDRETLVEDGAFEALKQTDFQALETLEDWAEGDLETPSTKDLANYLKRERRLYLWWD